MVLDSAWLMLQNQNIQKYLRPRFFELLSDNVSEAYFVQQKNTDIGNPYKFVRRTVEIIISAANNWFMEEELPLNGIQKVNDFMNRFDNHFYRRLFYPVSTENTGSNSEFSDDDSFV